MLWEWQPLVLACLLDADADAGVRVGVGCGEPGGGGADLDDVGVDGEPVHDRCGEPGVGENAVPRRQVEAEVVHFVEAEQVQADVLLTTRDSCLLLVPESEKHQRFAGIDPGA